MPETRLRPNRKPTQIRLDPDVRQILRDRWAKTGASQADSVNDAVRRIFGPNGRTPTKPAA